MGRGEIFGQQLVEEVDVGFGGEDVAPVDAAVVDVVIAVVDVGFADVLAGHDEVTVTRVRPLRKGRTLGARIL